MLLSFNFSLSLLCGFCVLCTCRVSYLEQDGKPVPAALEGRGVRVSAADAVPCVAGGWQCPLADSGWLLDDLCQPAQPLVYHRSQSGMNVFTCVLLSTYNI